MIMDFALGALLFVSLAVVQPPQDGSHVRTMNTHLQTVIAEGMARSSSFRELVTRIDASDVIVYAELECTMSERLFGNLTFMSAAGGRRFVMIRISCALTSPAQVAALGHELRHAVEIANAPSVVNEVSLAAEYRRIGFPARAVSRGFDSRAAIETGQRIWVELSHTAE